MVRLIASVTMERDIALAVIAITAVLVFVVPATNNSSGNIASRAASSTGSNTVDVTKTTPTGTVRLVLEPVEVGDNSIDLYFATTSGSVRQVDAVVVTISSAQVPARKIAVDLGVGSIVRANPVSFAVRGRWKITVKYATQGVAEVVNFEVEIQ